MNNIEENILIDFEILVGNTPDSLPIGSGWLSIQETEQIPGRFSFLLQNDQLGDMRLTITKRDSDHCNIKLNGPQKILDLRRILDLYLAMLEQRTEWFPIGGEAEGFDINQKKPGRPGLKLNQKEYIYRLAKAQEAEEIRRADPSKTWKEIAKEINWRLGYSKSGVKLLEDARKRLLRVNSNDLILAEIKEYREKEKKKIT